MQIAILWLSAYKFCVNFEDFRIAKPIDRLISNADIYQPSLHYTKWSLDGHEQTMQDDQSSKVFDVELASNWFKYSTDITETTWSDHNQVVDNGIINPVDVALVDGG